MLNSFIYSFLIIFLIIPCYSRDNTIIFFDRKVERRYYQNEFFNKITYKAPEFKKLNYTFQKESVKYSSSIELRTFEEKINIFDNKGNKKESNSIIFKFKTISKGGAIELDISSINIPDWANCITLWILNDGSEVDGYIYIKYPEKVVRYSIGLINHNKWKRFNIKINNSSNSILKRIKFINRGKRSSLIENTIALSKDIEFFSEYIDEMEIKEYIRIINPTELLLEKNINKGILKIITDKPSYYRFSRGHVLDKNEFIILELESDKEYILEVIGGLIDNRKKLFVMQINVTPEKENYYLILKPPLDVYEEFNESSSVVFWGIGIIPVKERVDLTIKKVILSYGY